MATQKTIPTKSTGYFSSRVSGPIGGNSRSGPFWEMPITARAGSARRFYEYFNDFDYRGNFDTTNFEWNHFDGSDTAYDGNNPGTAIARVPDWQIALIGSASVSAGTAATGTLLTAAYLLNDAPYGVLRVDAGTTDATGSRVSRSTSGSSLSEIIHLSSTNDNIVGGEFRFRYTETGTANEGAFCLGWHMDDATTLTTAGALAGTIDQFGFWKTVGSSTLTAYTRAAATTTNTLSVGTIVSGTWYTIGWRAQALTTGADASFVDVWLDGTFIGTTSASSSNSDLTTGSYAPFAAVVNGTGADCTLDIDYISAVQSRTSVA